MYYINNKKKNFVLHMLQYYNCHVNVSIYKKKIIIVSQKNIKKNLKTEYIKKEKNSFLCNISNLEYFELLKFDIIIVNNWAAYEAI